MKAHKTAPASPEIKTEDKEDDGKTKKGGRGPFTNEEKYSENKKLLGVKVPTATGSGGAATSLKRPREAPNRLTFGGVSETEKRGGQVGKDGGTGGGKGKGEGPKKTEIQKRTSGTVKRRQAAHNE